ncbi:MAG: hypothetical protein KF703_18715 [Actinobacteria bacterium]|nr:hypothetical protein [Actinomycetota bacterium]
MSGTALDKPVQSGHPTAVLTAPHEYQPFSRSFQHAYRRPMLGRNLRRTSPGDPFATVAPRGPEGDPPTRRRPRTRRPVPNGRATLGGLLVASAMVATWWVAVGSGRSTTTRFVVTTRSIDPGQRLEAADVRLVPMDLPPTVRAGAFNDPSAIDGTISLGPLAAGELVQEGALAPAPAPTGREFSFAVDTPWAVDGSLRSGDRIDVFATVADGDRQRTTKVLAGAVVRHLSATGGGLGESTGLTITVAVDGAARLEGAVSALRGSALTVARATGVTPTESAQPSPEPAGDDASTATTTSTTPKRSTSPSGRVSTTTAPPGGGR